MSSRFIHVVACVRIPFVFLWLNNIASYGNSYCGMMGLMVSLQHLDGGSIPARHSGLKDPVLSQLGRRLQLWLGSDPWPRISAWHGAVKKEKKIVSYVYNTFHLSFHLSMGIWPVSTFWLLWIMLLWMWSINTVQAPDFESLGCMHRRGIARWFSFSLDGNISLALWLYEVAVGGDLGGVDLFKKFLLFTYFFWVLLVSSVVSISAVQQIDPITHTHTHIYIFFFSYYLPSCFIPRDWL